MYKVMRKVFSLTLLAAGAAALLAGCGRSLKEGDYVLQLLTTNDVHGSYFDSTYVGGGVRKSLFAVKTVVDSVRAADGADNVVLVDAGDFLQGDNAAYYFNYVDTVSPHVYPRLAARLGYDAVTVGNHDIETGHKVYDRIAADLKAEGIPFLGGNAIRTDNGEPYFPLYRIVRRGGLKVAILGFTNANMKNWLSEKLWSGMTFESLLPLVQEDVDKVTAKEKPDVVIVSVHSGTGAGDGSMLESQGLDLYKSLRGVDFLICSHDHRPFTASCDSIALINSGSHCRFVGHGTLRLKVEGGKITERSVGADLIPVDPRKVDTLMAKDFHEDYQAVQVFTTQEVGDLKVDMRTRDAYTGMCDYVNLVHTLGLGCSPAQISIAAPLTYDGFVKAGTLIYKDLFTIYPYENQLYVITMTGLEIKNYLEASYNRWIVTASGPSDHVLNIISRDDPRTGAKGWSFAERSYNFDSAAGIDYTVDVTRPYGSRISISSMADGTPFSLDSTYNVAMTSYRASGGGGLLREVGIDTDRIAERTVEYYPEIRELLYEYLKAHHEIDPAVIGDPSVIGHWEFVPEKTARPALDRDLALLFEPKDSVQK